VPGDYRLDCPAEPAALDLIHDLFARVGEERDDVDGTDLMLMETAVIEIAGNVIAHGRPAGSITMALTFKVTDTALDVRLRETGQPPPDSPSYAMPDAEAEHGRGLPLCAAILDTFAYDRVEDANVWHLAKKRST
jgi:serine/threonine-protein kinase RsbW